MLDAFGCIFRLILKINVSINVYNQDCLGDCMKEIVLDAFGL